MLLLQIMLKLIKALLRVVYFFVKEKVFKINPKW